MAILNGQIKIGQSSALIFTPKQNLKSFVGEYFQDFSLLVTVLHQLLQLGGGNIHGKMVKMGIPYLPHSKCHSQEQESRCNLAITYLAILIVHFTLFFVPLHLKPQN